MGLASARLRAGDLDGAVKALTRALSEHVLGLGIEGLANIVTAASGAPGWVGLSPGRIPVIHTSNTRAVYWLDGRRLQAGLPERWTHCRRLEATVDGVALIGSPINLPAIARAAGWVEPVEDGIRGWAWHPGDPDTNPVITLRAATGRRSLRIVATDEDGAASGSPPLSRPRGFTVTGQALLGWSKPIRVTGRDGHDLAGSPLDPGAIQNSILEAARTPASHRPPETHRPPAAIVIPVHGHPGVVLACLDSVFAAGPRQGRIVVVDDASPEPALVEALDRMAAEERIILIRNPRRLGFPASANAGMAACADHDVVLLNSDTLVPPGWLERLGAAAHAQPDIGTVTPLSNNATIATYPQPGAAGPMPDQRGTTSLDHLAAGANGGRCVEVPVGVGFCLYIRRSCLNETGPFRAGIFAQGYGEENDFCLRASQLGWRHVVLTGLFVAHLGGQSFGEDGHFLKRRNQRLLEQLHPGYAGLVEAFLTADPLGPARRRIDLRRWRAAQPRQPRESVIFITHADGGGVEQMVAAAVTACRAAGKRAIVLRPGLRPDGRECVVVSDGIEAAFPNLRYLLPEERNPLSRLLRATHPILIEVHHLLDHPPAIQALVTDLGCPYDVHIHDYAWFCPRISLLDGQGRYCGEPDSTGCQACIGRNGRLVREAIGIEALRSRSESFLAGARVVAAPSRDAAIRIRRHFEALTPVVRPYGDDTIIANTPPVRRALDNCRVCVAGTISRHKGFEVVLACARDAASRRLPLEFIIVGDTVDDTALLDTGRAFITGTYQPEEAVALIAGQQAHIGFLPSIIPETWSLTLSELWRAGLTVAAFDLGAPAERIKGSGRGFTLPLGLSSAAINNALLAASGWSGHE